jgi:hypothetical protein
MSGFVRRAILLDAPARNPWPGLLSVGAALLGPLDWWPSATPTLASSIIAAMPRAVRPVSGRPQRRPWRFRDAGITLLRTTNDREPEIWCRCDGGPHGYLKTAAHAHADSLSVELRYGGVDILADAGTYCYHGDPAWRAYFRSTLAHNTIELDGQNQSADGGPFFWLRHARCRELDAQDIGDAADWTAEHDGYFVLDKPTVHRRCVRLDRASRTVDIVDEVDADGHDLRMAIHLGPEVAAELAVTSAILTWRASEAAGAARLELPAPLRWSLHRGETDPILGWYSAGLGRRAPAFTLLGTGRSTASEPLNTRLEFLDIGPATDHSFNHLAVSWCAADALMPGRPAKHAELG